jgi:hypothetical protein
LTSKTLLYRLESLRQGVQLEPIESHSATAPLRARYTTYTTYQTGGGGILAAYANAEKGVDLYGLSENDPWITYATSINVEGKWNELSSFLLANIAHLMLYRSDNGQFLFLPLDSTLRVTSKYLFYRNHPPSVSKQFTMVHPFVLQDGITVMGYAYETGAVCLYSLAAIPSSPEGTAPLVATPTWDHVWAAGWTRFAFFNFGGEVFFLKTNAKYPNVNIDHVLDNPSDGTVEVATKMHLVDAQKLSIVEPFWHGGHPHFLAYRPDGLTTLYRIHSDCKGWTSVGSQQLPADATAVVPLTVGASQMFLVAFGGD